MMIYRIYKFKEGFLLKYKYVKKQSGGNGEVGIDGSNIEEVMNKIYHKMTSPYLIENNNNTRTTHAYPLYGEIKISSVSKLLKDFNISKNDVFFDLGSGSGKVTMQVFLEGGVKKSVGVEYFPERHNIAIQAMNNMYTLHPNLKTTGREIIYQQANIKDLDNLDSASVIFMCSTCYPEELLDVVFNKIKNSKNSRAVVTHKMYDNFTSILPNKSTIVLSCTWSENLTWYVYRK